PCTDPVSTAPAISSVPATVIVGEKFHINVAYDCPDGVSCLDSRRELRYTLRRVENLNSVPSSRSPADRSSLGCSALTAGNVWIRVLSFDSWGRAESDLVTIQVVEGTPRTTEAWGVY